MATLNPEMSISGVAESHDLVDVLTEVAPNLATGTDGENSTK